jgi:hypothetical protein
MKNIFFLFVMSCGLTFAQDITWGETFNADFVIDSAMTTDGKNWQIAASGDAGPYGKAYLSYSFTNYFDAEGQGEFTGFAWTQVGDKVVNASLQGLWKKEGKVFKMYSLDNDATNGVFNIVSGEVDFVAKTMKFKVAPIKD